MLIEKNPPTLFEKYSPELQKEMTSSKRCFHIYNLAAAHRQRGWENPEKQQKKANYYPEAEQQRSTQAGDSCLAPAALLGK